MKILPLFKLNVINKTTDNSKITFGVNNFFLNKYSLNQKLSLLLKTFKIYNNTFFNYINTNNNLGLILQMQKKGNFASFYCSAKTGDRENLNLQISNLFYCINKIVLRLKINSLVYNINLFIPREIISIYSNIKYTYYNNYIYKNIINTNQIQNAHPDIENIKALMQKGIEIINELDYQISLNKNIITKIKSNNVNEIIDSYLLQNNPNYTNNNQSSLLQAELINGGDKIKQLTLYLKQQLAYNKLLKTINKSNEIKIEQTIKSISNNNDFDYKTATLTSSNSQFVVLNSPSTSINKYLKSMSIYNKNENQSNSIINNYNNNRIFVYYSNIIGYNFNSHMHKLIKNAYKLIIASFKSMYTLISKPVFIFTPDKIIIQLFYYICIPNILKLKKLYNYANLQNNKLNHLIWKKRKSNIKQLFRKFRKININSRIILRKLSNVPLTKVYSSRFNKLCEILSKFFNKPIVLDLIRVHYPYNDSQILVSLLGIMINKIKLRIILRRLFEKAVIKNVNKFNGTGKATLNNNESGATACSSAANRRGASQGGNIISNIIPAFLSGISIKVAGRLLTQKVVPRQSVNITRRGALAQGKINFLDIARFTNKNKRGAFSLTIKSTQSYF